MTLASCTMTVAMEWREAGGLTQHLGSRTGQNCWMIVRKMKSQVYSGSTLTNCLPLTRWEK
jgi:hypothetical protein